MKKRIKAVSLVLALCSILCVLASCGDGMRISQKNLQKHNCYYYEISEYERYQLDFAESTVTVDHSYYTPSSFSASGKTLDSSRSTSRTYEYVVVHDTKSGKYGILVGGTTYYCEFYKRSGAGYGLQFEEPFLGISSRW